MDPELKKTIERNKQEALRRQEKCKEQQRLKLQNEAKDKSPVVNKHTSVVNNQRFSPYSKSNFQGQSSVLRSYNNNAVTLPKFKQANIANYLVSTANISPQKLPVPKLQLSSSAEVSSAEVASSSSCQANISSASSKAVTTSSNRKLHLTFSLISEHRFEVRCDFDQQVIDEFKKIPSKSFSSTTKLWSFALKHHNQLVSALRSLKKDMVVEGLSDFLMKKMLSEYPSLNESWFQQIEPKLLDSLLPFQKTGVLFGISRQGKVLIADDPGLGKTRQALGIVNYFKNLPVLIVTNASTREFWQQEIMKVLNIGDDNSVSVLSKDSHWERADYVICSYQSLDSNFQQLKAKNFESIIFDESHHIKNQKAKQTQNAQKLSKGAKRIIMLTGTPALNNPIELYNQLSMVDSNFMDYFSYTRRYCNGHYNSFRIYDATGSSNLEELKHLLNKTIMIRRIKGDVSSEFDSNFDSKKRECVIVQDITFLQSMKDEFDGYSSQLADMKKFDSKNEQLLSWYQHTAEIKVEAACCFLEKLLSVNSDKILAFAHHKVMMDALGAHLEKLKIPHVRIDGTVSGAQRSERVEIFQNKPKIRVALLSTLATNSGITLTAASTVCFFELEFTPSTIIQAEARAHRIGQKKQVKIFYLLAPGTADDVIWKMIAKKQGDLGKAGLVDKVEFLSSNMETTKFSIKQKSQDSSSDGSNDQLPQKNMHEIELEELEMEFLNSTDYDDDEDDDIEEENAVISSQELLEIKALEDAFMLC